MSANSKFTVTVHVLTLLAGSKEPLSSSFIAKSVNTNPVTIRKTIGLLHKAGLVETVPGSTGGAFLKKAPEQITLGDVYALVKQETLFGLHPDDPSPYCPIGRNIQHVLVGVFNETDRLIAESLSNKTIAGIIDEVLACEKC